MHWHFCLVSSTVICVSKCFELLQLQLKTSLMTTINDFILNDIRAVAAPACAKQEGKMMIGSCHALTPFLAQ